MTTILFRWAVISLGSVLALSATTVVAGWLFLVALTYMVTGQLIFSF